MAFDNKKRNEPRRNEYIHIDKVQVISPEGENLGVMDTYKALNLAQEQGLDLVEVGPNVRPPVCKIINYSKYLYDQNKKSRANKKGKAKETKEFGFTPVIDQGDVDHKVKRAKEYLSKGYPVKVIMVRKGRQTREMAEEVFDKILTNFSEYSSIEAVPVQEGNRISITFRANGKTENKQNSKKEDTHF